MERKLPFSSPSAPSSFLTVGRPRLGLATSSGGTFHGVADEPAQPLHVGHERRVLRFNLRPRVRLARHAHAEHTHGSTNERDG